MRMGSTGNRRHISVAGDVQIRRVRPSNCCLDTTSQFTITIWSPNNCLAISPQQHRIYCPDYRHSIADTVIRCVLNDSTPV